MVPGRGEPVFFRGGGGCVVIFVFMNEINKEQIKI